MPCPSPGDLPNPGIIPVSLMSPVLASGFFTTSATQETHNIICKWLKGFYEMVDAECIQKPGIKGVSSTDENGMGTSVGL